MKYRADVDGLRAIAVLAVLGFHAFPDRVPGGFVGVDVFFVISGFLISGIIFGGLEDQRFTFAGFYARRIRRIFPALLVVLAACYAAGWFLLFADRYAELTKHVAGGAGFVANYVLWSEAGYFDRAADTKPLQHLWSLGVEEQFYFVWPLMAWLAWKRRLDFLLVTMAVLLGSMYLNLDHIRRDLVGTFYSPFTRFWELMSGALLAYLMAERSVSSAAPTARRLFNSITGTPGRRAALGAAGLFLIAGSLAIINQQRHFPGVWAVLPVAGAALLIAAGPTAWINRRVLATPMLVGIGLISYPLYLWHWPILSFLRLLIGDTPPASIRLAALGASFVMAWATYVAIERPIRFGPRRRVVIAGLCVGMAAIGGAGYYAYRNDGLVARTINRTDKAFFVRYYESIRKTGIDQAFRLECDFMEIGTDGVKDHIASSCTTRGSSQTWFLWGDSYAQALSHGITGLLPPGAVLSQVATSHCRPSLTPIDLDVPGGRCERANGYALEKIAELKPYILILAQLGAHELTDWEALAAHVRGLGVKRVIVVGPVPMWLPSLPEVVVAQYWGKNYDRVGYGLITGRADEDRRLLAKYASSRTVTYASIISHVCDDTACQATVPGSNPPELVAFDAGHLTPRGSEFIAQAALRSILLGQ